MSLFDDLNALFDDSDDGDVVEAQIVDESPLETARRQLGKTRYCCTEDPVGVFHANGVRFGCGYAEARVEVDAETGLADIDIDSGLRVAPCNLKQARKLARRLNQGLIISGLVFDDEGGLHFRPKKPCDLAAGDNLEDHIGKGFSTLHSYAHTVAQLEAGRSAWDVAEDEKGDKANPFEAVMDRLRGMAD